MELCVCLRYTVVVIEKYLQGLHTTERHQCDAVLFGGADQPVIHTPPSSRFCSSAMAAQMNKKRKFCNDGVFKAELNEMLMRELAEDG